MKDEDVSVFQEVMPEVVTRAPRVSRIDTKNVFKPPWWFIEGNATVVVQSKYFSVPGIGLVLENGADVDEEPLQAPLYPAWEKDLPMEKHNVKTAERRGLMYLEYIGSPVLICKVIRVSTDTLTVQVRGTDFLDVSDVHGLDRFLGLLNVTSSFPKHVAHHVSIFPKVCCELSDDLLIRLLHLSKCCIHQD